MRTINKKNVKEIAGYLSMYKYIYLYGAGREARKTLEMLKKLNVRPTAVVVSDKSRNQEAIMDIPILQIDEISISNENVFVIGVSEMYSHEVETKLIFLKHDNIVKLVSKTETWILNRTIPKLEITARIGCEIQCRYCPQKVLYASYFKDDIHRCKEMSMENYKQCIRNIPNGAIVTFAGFVEPFLHPHGVEMIRYAHDQGHPIELYTTFVGLTKKQFDTIKDIPYREVVLHTPDERDYAKIPITEEYVKILDEALDLKKITGEPFIDSANCQSEPSVEFLKLARGRIRVESVLVDRAGTLEDVSLKHSRYKSGSIVCNRSDRQDHWVLLPDGCVVLCCMDFGLKHMLGNLLVSDYEEIINGSSYQMIRQQMSKPFQGEDLICRKCTSSSEIKGR